MTKKSDAPAIRFKGFSDAWEQRKAKEICSIGTGKSNTQDQVDDGKYPFYIRSDVPVRSNKYLYDCEAVITIGDGNIGKVFHYVNGKFDLHQRCYKMTDFKDIWGKYFFYYFSTKFYERAMKMTAKATVDSVRLEMISEMDIKKPPQISEQKQIAEFFANLDNLITLHQRKCANLCSPSQVVFSLLFATSTFSWEQRKFDEVFDCTVPNNTLSRAELSYDEGTVLNVHYGDVLIKYGSVLDVQKDDIPRIPHRCREDFNGALLQDGDVIIADTAEDETTGKACEIGNLQGSAIVSGLHTMVCRPRNRMALGYLGYYLNSNAYHHQLLPLMQGIKVLSLSRSNIQKTSVSYPIAVKEQQLIAYYFSQLDNLITLHQRECISFTGRADRLILTANKKRTTSSWEQRKFEEIAVRSSVICSDDTLPRVEYEDIVSGTGRLNKDIYAKQSIKSGIAFHQGDVLYGKLRPYLQNWLLPTFDGLAVGDFWVLQPQNADSSFLYRLIQSRQFDEVANQSTGTKMPRADWKLVSKTVFSIPSNISEQAAIGTYFTALDSLITLHQRKGKAAVSGCSNDANNSKGVCCKARDFGYKCHKKDAPNRFDA